MHKNFCMTFDFVQREVSFRCGPWLRNKAEQTVCQLKIIVFEGFSDG
ncbi:Hypothetical Protein XCAW_00629 [Xanthomonas citri subsp. citri Aw12879]|nr:Hypothetical Protein XCAW_00629 [Xanthomonas citri subsp. citri Aw12879]